MQVKDKIVTLEELKAGLDKKVDTSDVVNDSTSTDPTKVLAAPQGKVLYDKIVSRNTILYDEAIWSASKSYSIDAKTAVLVLARCNANQANTSPTITITGATQTAKNTGAAGGHVMCYMVIATSNASENITVTFENYTHGGDYNQYGHVTIIRLY